MVSYQCMARCLKCLKTLNKKMSDMKLLIISAIASVSFILGIFILDDKVISKLHEDSRFKKWWRRNLIGEMKEHD